MSMNLFRNLFLVSIAFLLMESCCKQNANDQSPDQTEVSDALIERYGITDKKHLSAASKRALKWPTYGNEWFIRFSEQPLKGDLAYEEGVVRRDPSAIIQHHDRYYVWYTKSTGPTQGFEGDIEKDKVFPWDRSDIWYATSLDGITWKEEGLAIPRGKKGQYDDRSVFTVEIMQWEGMYYLCYQTIKSPYTHRTKNQVGLAWSDSPDGPWTKSKEPILSPADNGEWLPGKKNRFEVIKKGDFDSHKVHDPCIIPFQGKFYLYYKGERMGEEMYFGGREIRHGVAIADNPKGPYIKSSYNPISNSGHEICVWKYNGGIASLITTDGPEKNTIQWSPDGINFEIMSSIPSAPHAIGLNRTVDNEKDPTEVMRWGLTHEYVTGDYQCIKRFTSRRKQRHGNFVDFAQ
ncbi:beta-xylosidase [Saccharicrinis fermentans DSM 9555 = JCM 21142]|uniref:Beta-xylosidase n=2 Tax=Saccharicrinis fermentans TaxID=982 RepID=W7Y5L6_9BACT|nr:beta-xylosidase [Saccharicrinis fermentans DSM 9555 = JCM 21142]